MARRKRAALSSTDNWTQLRLLCAEPAQETYELIRPVVLFGRSVAQRARETGVAARTIARKAKNFASTGMASLFPEPSTLPRQSFPEEMRQAILALKAEHPAFRPNELATICFVRFGRRPSAHTITKILADGPVPTSTTRRFAPYAEIADPIERRLAVVTLHAEGWNIASIAAYLQTNRPRVYEILERWIAEGVAGLADKPHTRKRRVLKTDLKAINEVRRLQENPELGEFRMHAALKQLGIELSPRTCGRILALNRKLYGLDRPKRAPHAAKPMPFEATRRHQYWTVDLRYLDMHQLGGGMIYVISILDNYSRAVLASGLSRSQDLVAFLIVLYAAVRAFGSPEALVSDSGSIFLANDARRIYTALGIAKEQIDSGQAWQSYIETMFSVQRRMADWHFAKATTWEELQKIHERWVADYNAQVHWAHRQREDKRHSPQEVLGWVTGRSWTIEELQQIFRLARGERRVNAAGYIRYRHWDVYGERGLAHQRIAVWLAAEAPVLTLAHREDPLAQYNVVREADRRYLKEVTPLRLFDTDLQSPQPLLGELASVEWRLAFPRPRPGPRRRRSLQENVQQSSFLGDNKRTGNR